MLVYHDLAKNKRKIVLKIKTKNQLKKINLTLLYWIQIFSM